MLLQTNSYIVPKERRAEHARLLRRFRQVLMRLGCDLFEVYEQMGPNWSTSDQSGRFVQIMRFRDRKHQREVHAAEQRDPAAQELISEFCELINLPYQQQQGMLAIGYYQGVMDVSAAAINRQAATPSLSGKPQDAAASFGFGVPPAASAGALGGVVARSESGFGAAAFDKSTEPADEGSFEEHTTQDTDAVPEGEAEEAYEGLAFEEPAEVETGAVFMPAAAAQRPSLADDDLALEETHEAEETLEIQEPAETEGLFDPEAPTEEPGESDAFEEIGEADQAEEVGEADQVEDVAEQVEEVAGPAGEVPEHDERIDQEEFHADVESEELPADGGQVGVEAEEEIAEGGEQIVEAAAPDAEAEATQAQDGLGVAGLAPTGDDEALESESRPEPAPSLTGNDRALDDALAGVGWPSGDDVVDEARLSDSPGEGWAAGETSLAGDVSSSGEPPSSLEVLEAGLLAATAEQASDEQELAVPEGEEAAAELIAHDESGLGQAPAAEISADATSPVDAGTLEVSAGDSPAGPADAESSDFFDIGALGEAPGPEPEEAEADAGPEDIAGETGAAAAEEAPPEGISSLEEPAVEHAGGDINNLPTRLIAEEGEIDITFETFPEFIPVSGQSGETESAQYDETYGDDEIEAALNEALRE